MIQRFDAIDYQELKAFILSMQNVPANNIEMYDYPAGLHANRRQAFYNNYNKFYLNPAGYIMYNNLLCVNYKKINNLISKNGIQPIKDFIISMMEHGPMQYDDYNIPDHVIDREKFYENFKDFDIDDDHNLIYNGLIVVEDDDMIDIINEEFYTAETGYRGQRLFYNLIRSKYLNISRKDVIDFIKDQQLYQLTKHKKPIKNEMVKYTQKNQAWSMDLIDMNFTGGNNHGFRYIFTCIDNFTKEVYIHRLRNKLALDVRNALRLFMTPQNKPSILYSDQGLEFKGIVQTYCDGIDVRMFRSESYTPIPIIESLNRQVRKILSKYFVENDNTIWYNKLPQVRDNINNYNKIKPYDVDKDTGNFRPFQVGDFCRVALTAMHSKARALVKTGKSKHLHMKWSVDVFKIHRIKLGRTATALPYHVLTLYTGEGEPEPIVMTANDRPKLWKFNDLQWITDTFNNDVEKEGNYILRAIN